MERRDRAGRGRDLARRRMALDETQARRGLGEVVWPGRFDVVQRRRWWWTARIMN